MPTTAYYSYEGGNQLPLPQTRTIASAQHGWTVGTGNPTILAPRWPDFTFPTAVTGVFYSEQWDLSPASPPTTYSLLSGTLPPGLALTSPSGNLGVLAGTPTTVGTYTFTLSAVNLYGTAAKTFTFIVAAGGGGGGAWTFAA